MEIDITGNLETIKIGARGREEIIQNVAIILSTVKGSVPLDRDFGIDNDFVDRPLPVTQAMMVGKIAAEVEKQEPRVKVTRVTFVENPGTADGVMVPKVSLKIKDGY